MFLLILIFTSFEATTVCHYRTRQFILFSAKVLQPADNFELQ